jgi:hypothetical protein
MFFMVQKMYLGVGKNFIENVLLDGGSRFNIITKKLRDTFNIDEEINDHHRLDYL